MDKKKVVGYARIGHAGAFVGNIHAQIEMIKTTVANHPEWEFCGIYVDEGMSGKGRRRFQFEQMMQDAEEHKFDCIAVKDVSRFTRDCIEAHKTLIRLKELGITVFFINEAVSSDDEEFIQRLELLSALKEKEREILSAKRTKKKE